MRMSQRYGKDYGKVYEIVKSGELVPIKQIRAAWIGGGLLTIREWSRSATGW